MAVRPGIQNWLLTLVPALAVGLGFYLIPFRDQQKRLSQAEQAESAARTRMPSPGFILDQQSQLHAATKEIERANLELTTVKRRWETAAGKLATLPNRPARIERLNRLLVQNGLHVIEESDLDSAKDQNGFGNAATSGQKLAEMTETTQARPRLLRVAGRYPEVTEALRSLSTSDLLAVPLGFTMTDPELGSSPRIWTLVFWV